MNILYGLKNTIDIDKSLSEYYEKNNNYELSIEYSKKVIETCTNIISISSSENIDFNLSEIEIIINDTNERLSYLHYVYAELCFKNKNWEKSINLYKYVLASKSDVNIIFNKVAKCFNNLNETDVAILFFNKSTEGEAKFIDSYREIADIYYHKKNNYNKAIEFYEKYNEFDTSNFLVYNMLGHLYNKTGEIETSYDRLLSAVNLNPNHQMVISNLLFTLQKIPEFSQKEIYNISKKYIDNYLQNINIQKYQHQVKEEPKIHIGYLSGDLNQHVIMLYLLPILENHDKEKFIISCYSNTLPEDEDLITIKCELLVDNFINISDKSDKELSEIIFSDNVDILVDLSGYTAKTRIFSTLYKPAPIQISYMGFPNTTGMETFDYYFTNKNMNHISDEEYFSEKLYFLDSCYRCFKYNSEITNDISELPSIKNGYITFGVFNDLSKINNSVIEVWSEILKKEKDSKLLICRSTIIEEFLYKRFEKCGIDKDRLIFDKDFALNKYNLVDIHLDTFPYTGVTVIFDSAIMGVPTLTLSGNTFAGREAANINKYLGLEEFIANTIESYIEKALSLSKETEKLVFLRKNLRRIYENSEFSDYKRFTKSLESAYMDIWSRHKY